MKDSIIFPEAYRISEDWDVYAKARVVTATNGKKRYKAEANVRSHLINWYPKINLVYNGKRKVVLVHRLVYCTYNGRDYDDRELVVWHHNDIAIDCRLSNLYATNQTRNLANRSLAYKLLDLYRKWIIHVDESLLCGTEL